MIKGYKGALPELKAFIDEFITLQYTLMEKLNSNSFGLDSVVQIYVDTLFYKHKAEKTKPFVLECVPKHPRSFYYYILNLVNKGTDKLIIENCLEALDVISSTERVRDDISKLMMQYAKKTSNSHLISRGKLESFVSNPSEENLIQLFEDQHPNKQTSKKQW